MRSTTVGSALLLLAGAVVAQSESIVSTIQTSVPTSAASVCYEVCIQEPCYACSATPSDDPAMSLPVESLPVPSSISDDDVTMTLPVESLPVPTSISDGDVTMTLPVESLPPVGSEPTPSVTGITTHPLLPTVPPTTGPPQSTSELVTSSVSGNATASASRSAPPEQTTAAAPPSLKGGNMPFMLALCISSVSIFFGAAWTLL